jgi:hypothetical protein
MKVATLIVIFLIVGFEDSFAQIVAPRNYDLGLDTLTSQQIVLEDLKSNYLSNDFNRSGRADSAIIELFFKNEKIAAFPSKSPHFINLSRVTTIKREVLVLNNSKRVLKTMFFVQ